MSKKKNNGSKNKQPVVLTSESPLTEKPGPGYTALHAHTYTHKKLTHCVKTGDVILLVDDVLFINGEAQD